MSQRFVCQMTEEGRRTFRGRWNGRTGKVIGETSDKQCWIVQWDDAKTANQFEKRFIERVAA